MTLEVQSLAVTPSADGRSAALAWGVSGTSYLTGFVVVTKLSTGVVFKRDELPATARALSVTGLTPGARYSYVVYAAEEVGSQTVEATQPAPAPPPPPSSITTRLTPDGTGVEVVSLPAGADQIGVAVMKDLNGTGLKTGINIPVTQKIYQPEAALPVVDMQARKEGKPLGGWAGRIMTRPLAPPPPPPPPPEEPPVEPPPPPPAGRTKVALNQSGWGAGEWADTAPAVKMIRLGHTKVTDSEIDAMAKVGQRVVSVIFGEGGTIGAINTATYASEVVAFFKRYGRGGTFWQGKPYGDMGVECLEVLNEAYGNWFWKDSTNVAGYARLLRSVWEAFQANFPPEIRPKVLADFNAAGSSWDTGLVAQGATAWMDGGIVHPYGGASGSHGGAAGDWHSIEWVHQLTGKPIYVTEVGWPTAVGQPPTGDSQQWTESQQAANIKGFIEHAKASPYVPLVVIFGYRDYGTNAFYGIEDHSGRRKPSYAALASVSG